MLFQRKHSMLQLADTLDGVNDILPSLAALPT